MALLMVCCKVVVRFKNGVDLMYPEPKGTHYIIVGIVNKCFLFTIIIKGMQWGMGIQLESPV